jgi:inosine-uridine nucleoside N-ribohydrolase
MVAMPQAPLIIDTDAGTDPDDAVALVIAARADPELRLVLTNDELGGERARFVRHLLNLAGRSDVRVVRGADLPGAPALVVEHLIPADIPAQSADVHDAVLRVVEQSSGEPLRWLGIGAMTNLAAVLTAAPGLAERLRVTQMGGALNYRDPNRAEHNFRRDPGAVAVVLALAARPSFVMSEHTFRPEIGIGPEADLYRRWGQPGAPDWARVLRAHHDGFFAQFHPESLEHDPLTLSTVLGEPFVTFTDATVALDAIGRMRLEPDGAPVRLSARVDYDAFLQWLDRWVGLTNGLPDRPGE